MVLVLDSWDLTGNLLTGSMVEEYGSMVESMVEETSSELSWIHDSWIYGSSSKRLRWDLKMEE